MFVALGGSIADAIATKPNSSLNNSDAFKAVTGSLQQLNAGYFYLDRIEPYPLSIVLLHKLMQLHPKLVLF